MTEAQYAAQRQRWVVLLVRGEGCERLILEGPMSELMRAVEQLSRVCGCSVAVEKSFVIEASDGTP